MNSIYSLLLIFAFSYYVNGEPNTFRNIRKLRNCRSYEPIDYKHKDFIEIDTITNGFNRFENNTIKFQSFILSRRDVNIFLSTTNDPHRMEGYEIHVGVFFTYNKDRGISIDRYSPGQNVERMNLEYVPDLWENGPRKIGIEIENDGRIAVLADDKPVLQTYDPLLFNVKYVSFVGNPESYHLVMYNCTMSSKERDPTVIFLDGGRAPSSTFYKHESGCN